MLAGEGGEKIFAPVTALRVVVVLVVERIRICLGGARKGVIYFGWSRGLLMRPNYATEHIPYSCTEAVCFFTYFGGISSPLVILFLIGPNKTGLLSSSSFFYAQNSVANF